MAICALPAVIDACADLSIRRNLEDLLQDKTKPEAGKPRTSLSQAFVTQAKEINSLIAGQVVHAAWALLWADVFKLCS
jgi:hypothetical protein